MFSALAFGVTTPLEHAHSHEPLEHEHAHSHDDGHHDHTHEPPIHTGTRPGRTSPRMVRMCTTATGTTDPAHRSTAVAGGVFAVDLTKTTG